MKPACWTVALLMALSYADARTVSAQSMGLDLASVYGLLSSAELYTTFGSAGPLKAGL
jgi:hypothetical protein